MEKNVAKNMEEASTSLLMTVFKSEKPIDTQLPIVFKSGYKLEEFNTKCHCCSATLKGNQFKGSIFKVAKNSRFECWSVDKIDNSQTEDTDVDKIMIDAVGFCPQCSVYTPCQVHVEDKGLSQDEAEARERMISEKRKEKKHKSFLGLTIQRMDGVKSQRNRAVKAEQKIHGAALSNLGVDNGKKVETTKLNKLAQAGVSDILVDGSPANNLKKTEFLRQSNTVKKSLIENRIEKILDKEDSKIGKSDNITDINAIARHNLQEATNNNSKSIEAYQVGAMLSQAVVANPVVPVKNAMKRGASTHNTSGAPKAPKLAFLQNKNIATDNSPSIATQKLHSAMSDVNSSFTNQEISLTRKSHEEKVSQVQIEQSNDERLEVFPESSKASLLLRGQRRSLEQIEPSFDEPTQSKQEAFKVDEPLLRRDSRGIKGSSTSAAAKIEKQKKYVQSSGSIGEKLSEVFFGFIGLFSKGYQKIKTAQEDKQKNILKNHQYKADKAHGRESARNRLESLRNNKEFERVNVSKTKVKKHSHDSFR